MADSTSPPQRLLGHYRLVRELGAGGMGVVYSAYDTILEREVAIKVVSDRTLADTTVRRLLLHEARLASCLNHPNICTVHEVGDSNGEAYIVMEQVNGQPLNAIVGVNGLPAAEVVRYGIQIADALAHAHERGVIHRDLKSTNVVVTPDGRGKVLDFGLAARLNDTQLMATVSSRTPLSQSKALVGTLPYLAPELLRGEAADVRTDTWALGVLLYEMASAKFPFYGGTAFELCSKILKDDPEPLPMGVPASLCATILKCLDKSPADRYQSAADIRADLQNLNLDLARPDAPVLAVTVNRDRVVRVSDRLKMRRFRHVLSLAGLLLLAGFLLSRWLSPLPPPKVLHITQLTHFGHVEAWGKLTTDGARILYLRRETGGTSLMQVPTTGGDSQPFPTPFPNVRVSDLSPDRSELLLERFSLVGSSDMELWSLPLVGGSARRLSNLTGNDAVFSPDGSKIAFCKVDGIYVSERNGSEPHKIISLPGDSLGLAWSPDGKTIRFTMEDKQTYQSALWEVSSEGSDLRPVFPDWNEHRRDCCGQWSPDGRYFFFSSNKGEPPAGPLSVWARKERASADPWSKPGLPVRLTAAPVSFGFLRASSDGARLFVAGVGHEQVELLRVSPDRKTLSPVLGSQEVRAANASPDGRWLALILTDWSLWRSRADGTGLNQVSVDFNGYADVPRWSPDGTRIVFQGRKEGRASNIFVVNADGGPSEELLQSDQPRESPEWSPDGKSIVFNVPSFGKRDAKEETGIYILDLKSRKTSKIPQSAGMGAARLSLDGRELVALSADLTSVMLFDMRTQAWRPIAHGTSLYRLQSSADGRYIYFQDILGQGEPLFRMRDGEWKPERVMSFETMLQADVVRCRFTGVTPDGSPMVIAVRGGYEIYSLDLSLP